MTGTLRKPHSWPPDDIALLRKLWAAGNDAAYIARQIGCGLTRNAVIGKAKRLGLPPHATGRLTYKGKFKQARIQFRTTPKDDRVWKPGDPSPYSRQFIEKRSA